MRVYLPLIKGGSSGVPTNRTPVTTNCQIALAEDTSATIDLGTVVSDPDGDPLTFSIQAAPAHGTATFNQRTLTYAPAANFASSDLVIYRVTDGRGASVQGTIGITVTPVNDPPIVMLTASPIAGTAPLPPTFTINANDPDGDLLTYTWAFGDGAIASTPDSMSHRYGHVGVYTAMVTVSDGQTSASASQVVTINRRSDGLPDDPETIAPPLDVTVATNIFSATEFLYTGDRPIQTGVTSGTIEARRVGLDGIISTIAGVAGQLCAPATDPCGDDGLAARAKLTNPYGLAVGQDGSLYVSEFINHRIRRISPDGFITTIAGTGKSCSGQIEGACGDTSPAP